MKEKVFEAIKRAGANGIRLRYIGSYVGVWHPHCLPSVTELLAEGRIYERTIGRGWEAYIKYYVKEQ